MTRLELESLFRRAQNAQHRFCENNRYLDRELDQFEKLVDWLQRHRIPKIPRNHRDSNQLCRHLSEVFGEHIYANVLGLALIATGYTVWSTGGYAFNCNVSAAVFNITDR